MSASTEHGSTERPTEHRDTERGPSPRRSRDGGRWTSALFVGPLVAVFLLFYLWPAVQTILSSLFEWSLLGPWKPFDTSTWRFVGLDNYTGVLGSGDFWNAAVNTFIWLILLPLLVGVFSLVLALVIWFLGRGSSVFRSVFVLPLTISLAAVGVVWGFLYNPDPDIGVFNAILTTLHLDGLGFDVGWLELNVGDWLSNLGHLDIGPIEIKFTNFALVMPAFWAFTGFGVITFTAGLTSLSDDLVEAARIDGAGPWATVRYVIIPTLKGPMIIVLVQMVIFALRTFDIVYVMTGGGPAQDTTVLALLLYLQGFTFLDSPQAGQAAAIAVLLSAALVAGAFPYLRRLTRKEA